MPLYLLSTILFSGVTRFINSKYLIKINHMHRLTFNSFYIFLSYLLVAAVTIWEVPGGFALSLVGAVMHGTSMSFGESTILGFMKGYPSKLVGAFSSGTGFAGAGGAGIIMLLKPLMKEGYIFLVAIPSVIVYYLACYNLTQKREKYPFVEEINENSSITSENSDNEDAKSTHSERTIDIGDDANKNIALSCDSFSSIFSKMSWILINYMIVDFLEFTVITGFADAYSNQQEDEGKYHGVIADEGYVILSF